MTLVAWPIVFCFTGWEKKWYNWWYWPSDAVFMSFFNALGARFCRLFAKSPVSRRKKFMSFFILFVLFCQSKTGGTWKCGRVTKEINCSSNVTFRFKNVAGNILGAFQLGQPCCIFSSYSKQAVFFSFIHASEPTHLAITLNHERDPLKWTAASNFSMLTRSMLCHIFIFFNSSASAWKAALDGPQMRNM